MQPRKENNIQDPRGVKDGEDRDKWVCAEKLSWKSVKGLEWPAARFGFIQKRL